MQTSAWNVTPAFSNLGVHYQADTFSHLSDNQNITSIWTDNGGKELNASSYNNPVFRAGVNGINGKPAIQFNGSNSYFDAGNTSLSFSGMTLFTVAKLTVGPDSNRALVSKDGGGCPSRFNLNRDSGGFFRFEFNSDYATTSTYVGESAIVTATHASNQISIVKNGGGSSLYSVGSLSGTTSCPLQIGANTYGSNYFNGLISEVLIFTNGLDNADKEIVQCYLSTKYRIAVEHPCQ